MEIAKVQSTEASNAIEGIVTTNTRIRQLVEEKTTPRNRDEQEIAGYRDVLNLIHENFDAIPITQNYILQLHKILYSHMNNPMAGRTKNVQNYISATYPDGHVETLFTPLAPYETPEALDRIDLNGQEFSVMSYVMADDRFPQLARPSSYNYKVIFEGYQQNGLPVAELKRALWNCVQEARRQAAIQQVENLGFETKKPKGTKGHER